MAMIHELAINCVLPLIIPSGFRVKCIIYIYIVSQALEMKILSDE